MAIVDRARGRLVVGLLGAALLAACGHAVGNDSPPDPDGGIASDAEVDAGPPPECGVAIVPNAPLCGGPRAPTCSVALDLTLPDPLSSVERYASLTAHPGGGVVVAYRPRNDDGVLTVRIAGDATAVGSLDFQAFASASLATTPGDVFALGRPRDRSSEAQVARFANESWAPVAGFDGLTSTDLLVGDSGGCVHAVVNSGAPTGLVARRIAGGQVGAAQPIGAFRGASFAALDATGTLHVASVVEGPALRWRAGALDEEVLASDTRNLRLAVAGVTPHLLFDDAPSLGPARRLVYATRDATGWGQRAIAADTHVGCDRSTRPSGPTDRCQFVETTHHPIAVLTNVAGEVGLLYSVRTQSADYEPACGGEDLPPDICLSWQLVSATFLGALHLVVVPPVGPPSAPVVLHPDLPARDGRAVLAADGLHMVVEISVEQSPGDAALHYLHLVPGP